MRHWAVVFISFEVSTVVRIKMVVLQIMTLQGGCKCSEESAASVGLYHVGDWGGLFLWSLNHLQDSVLSNPNNNNHRCNILYIIEEWFWNVCHMCCVCLMFGSDHEIFLLQATGRCATSTKCTGISDIWWFERAHNSCCAGIKHTVTKHLCQQTKILFQWQVVKGVLWRNITFVFFYFCQL